MTTSHGESSPLGALQRLAVIAILIAAAATLLMPTPEGMRPEGQRLIAVTILMAGLWVTQPIPLAATSLLPLALFPLFGIQTAADVSQAYINDKVFLYLGGFIIAVGIERWNLHRRIALRVVSVVGVSPRRLVLGFLLATGGLSMWISNTAATLLMLPIGLALLKTLDDEQLRNKQESATTELISTRLAVPLLLAIAYSASIGGMTTIIGTPTNNQAVAIYEEHFCAKPDKSVENENTPTSDLSVIVGETKLSEADGATVSTEPVHTYPRISVAQWMIACIPLGAIYMAMTWFVLTRRLPRRTSHDESLKQVLKQRLKELGRPSTAEIRMLIVFASTALLWVFRKPLILGSTKVLPGWSDFSGQWFGMLGLSESAGSPGSFVNDSTISMMMAILLFCIPSGTRNSEGRSVALMNWSTAAKLPWDIVLLFGGGFALAGAFVSPDLSGWLGETLQEPLKTMPVWLVIAVVCLLMTFLTEFTSNVATISTLLPTLCALTVALDIDPRLMVVPSTLATSCAFMLPIATPPNAIVFGSGRIRVSEMVRYGLILNLVGVPILTAGTWLFIKPLMGIP